MAGVAGASVVTGVGISEIAMPVEPPIRIVGIGYEYSFPLADVEKDSQWEDVGDRLWRTIRDRDKLYNFSIDLGDKRLILHSLSGKSTRKDIDSDVSMIRKTLRDIFDDKIQRFHPVNCLTGEPWKLGEIDVHTTRYGICFA